MKHKKKTWYVYILECSDKTLYTGSTNDLKKRLRQHNESKAGARYTKARRPVKLVYKEKASSLSAALKREVQVKNFTKEKKSELISW